MSETLDREATEKLRETFNKPEPMPIHPLPPYFDDSCRKCDTKMEHMQALISTRHRPFAIFQCPDCLARLFLFHVSGSTLLVWSNTIPSASSISFSDFIDRKIIEHERKRQIRKEREKAEVLPTTA